MAYYLVSGSRKEDYLLLPLRTFSSFIPMKHFKQPSACTLEEIDLFTSLFKNNRELKESLIREGILPTDRGDKALSIRNYFNKQYNRVPYDLIYSDSVKYLHDTDNIIKEIYGRYMKHDYKFLQALGNNFLKDYKLGRFAVDVRGAANISMQTNEHYSKLFDEPFFYMFEGDHFPSYYEIVDNFKITDLMKGFLMTAIYESYSKTVSTRDYGEIEVIIFKKKKNYPNVHELITFMNNYDNNLSQDKKEQPKEVVPAYREKFDEAVKKKARKKVDPNQLTIWDALNDDNK